MRKRSLIPIFYIIFLMLPIYWLVVMSFKTTNEILAGFSLFPQTFTLDSYIGSTTRLAGLSWGAEDLASVVGASTNRDADGRWLSRHPLGTEFPHALLDWGPAGLYILNPDGDAVIYRYEVVPPA